MAIEQNDGVLTKIGKPTDVKRFVGTSNVHKYTKKEDIPNAYRYPGMRVNEEIGDVWKEYRWIGDNEGNGQFVELTNSSDTLKKERHYFKFTEVNTGSIGIPIGFTNSNSDVFINGVILGKVEYTIAVSQNHTSISFAYHLEIGDVLIIVRN